MNIYIMDRNFSIIDIIDDYTSLIWTTKYFTSGDFEIYCVADEKHISLLREDYFLCREEDMIGDTFRNVMIIKNIEITTDVENGDYLIVKGKSLKSIVGKRIVWQQTNLSGNIVNAISIIIDQNIVNPTIVARKIANFVLDDIAEIDGNITAQVTGDNIETWLGEICQTYRIGWDVFIRDNQFVFTLWSGADRSYDQDENSYVVFSQEYDNLLKSNYKANTENYKNVALVAGEGEGLARKTHVVGEASDLDRNEIYVDARDISTNDGEIDDATYSSLLAEKGEENLAENKMEKTFDAEIEPNTTYELNVDYFLGDLVQVENEHGIYGRCRITEVIDSDDENGRTVIPIYQIEEIKSSTAS